jgi:CIC family chloride channel protein
MALGAAHRPALRAERDFRTLLRRGRIAWAGLRRDLRAGEPAQILACAVLGAGVGVTVDLLRRTVMLLHSIDFGIPEGSHLSAGIGIDHLRIVIVPALGGLILGLVARAMRKGRASEIVDPIEANALYGGRMSLRDSLTLVMTNLISNGAGASLGMEAGYSQLGAALYSRAGQYFGLRRADLRLFVTAGAGAAIAAAFNAPLAGAFYGFELILSGYAPRALAPVAVAALCSGVTARSLSDKAALFHLPVVNPIMPVSYGLFVVMGVLAAGIAVLAMQAVTSTERSLRRTPLPAWARPILGGAVLSLIALFFPQVLGGGHGAIQLQFDTKWALIPLIGLLIAKILASAISVGSGFRGGLFSSSIFLGCLFGATFADIVTALAPAFASQRDVFILAGMAAVAAGVVGGPLTMVFLILEGTGNFAVTVGVLAAVIVASTIVRLFFGYSFSTWRFHLRGLAIRSAHDVGWISDLTAGRLMRADPKLVDQTLPLRALREKYPPGAAKRLFAADGQGRYVGIIDVSDIHDPEIDAAADALVARDLARLPDLFLVPDSNLRTALVLFEETRTEVLPVLESRADRQILGYLTEAYALRRYNQELERMHSAELGEQDLFSLGRVPRG